MAYAVRDQAVAVRGFRELQASLNRIASKSDFGVEYELQRRLRVVGEKIAQDAPGYVTHKTGRGSGELERSVKVAVTMKQASVYSTSEHGGAQNSGAGPHAGWAARGPHIQKANASRWMIKAVQANREFVAAEMNGLLDWVVREFEAG